MGLLDNVKMDQGVDSAEKIAEEFSPASGYDRTNFFSLKAKGDSTILRFLQEQDKFFTTLMHQMVPTKPKPKDADEKIRWFDTMSAVCRHTPAFKAAGLFSECYICDHMTGNSRTQDGRYHPQTRLWATAVEREKVYLNAKLASEYGMTLDELKAYYEGFEEDHELGIRDVMITVDERDAEGKATGSKITKPKIVVVNMALKNFFSPLKGFAVAYNSMTDRDYLITRTAEGLETDYSIAPLDPIYEEIGGVSTKVTLDLPKFDDEGNSTGQTLLEYYTASGPDLMGIIESQVDDDRYHKWFDRRVTWTPPEKDKGGNGNGQAAPGTPRKVPPKAPPKGAPAPGGGASKGGPSAERLKGLREATLASGRGKSAAKPEEPAAEESSEPAEGAEPAEASAETNA